MADPHVAAAMVGAMTGGYVAICLCDANDDVRWCNAAFRSAFFGGLEDGPSNFVEALARAMRLGRGIKLDSMPLDTFITRTKARRRGARAPYRFAVDMCDGSWWQVNDHRTPEGWTFVVASEISELKQQEIALRHAHAEAARAAQTDFLTGLPNRRHGYAQGEATLRRGRETGLPSTVALLDIDHFKRVNDGYGHAVGDRVLIVVADFLRAHLRVGDQLSRIGGEEFMLVMPGTPASLAGRRLRRLLRRIPEVDVGPDEGVGPETSLRLTVSAGVASASDSLDDAVRRADAALYDAKAKGRDRVEVAASTAGAAMIDRVA